MNKRILMVTSAVASFASFVGIAAAQAQAPGSAPAAAPAAAPESTVGEVIVTAEKRSVNVQQVPVAVSAFTAKQRNLEGITTIQDISNFTPGLTYSSSLDRAAMRGLARLSNTLSADSSVAVYNDDLYSTSTYLVGLDDMFINQVEVERGPQGTLYGRNAIGGLINTTSKRPTDDFSGEVRASYGNFDAAKVEGTVSGPTGINGLDFRISGSDTNQDQGYLTNIAKGEPSEGGVVHDWYGNVMLEYKPDDKNDLWADFYSYGATNDRGGPGSLLGTPEGGNYDTGLADFDATGLTFNPNFGYAPGVGANSAVGSPYASTATGPVAGTVVGMNGITNNPTLSNIRDFSHSIPTTINVNGAYTFNFHWIHHFDGFDVKYVGGYSQYNYNLQSSLYYGDNSSITSYQVPLNPAGVCANTAGCTNLTVNPSENFNYTEHNHWFSHEITFSSTYDSPLQWIAGLYYYDQTYSSPVTVSLPGQSQLATPQYLGAGAAPANPSRNWYYTNYALETKSIASYGQVDWKITDTVKLTGGLRYTYDQKQGTEDYRIVEFSDALAGYGVSAENLGSSMQAYDITAAAMGAALSTPYKGVTCLPQLQANGQYQRCLGDSSSATTGTAGIEWSPDRDTLAYFRYNRGYKAFGFNAGVMDPNPEAAPELVDDYEIGFKQSIGRTFQYNVDAFYYNYMDDQVPVEVNTGALITTEFVNIPKAVSEGVELQMIWNPIRHLNLNFTYSFDDTFISSGCSLVNGVATGTCLVDIVDPLAQANGAKPVAAENGSVVQSVKGDELPQAPKNKIAFNANYTWEFEPGNFTLSGTYVWKDKSYAGVFTRTYDEAPSWNQVDMRGTWSGDHDRYEVVLYVRNLFNTLGYDAAGLATANYPSAASGGAYTQDPTYDLTPPRTYGIEVHYKF